MREPEKANRRASCDRRATSQEADGEAALQRLPHLLRRPRRNRAAQSSLAHQQAVLRRLCRTRTLKAAHVSFTTTM